MRVRTALIAALAVCAAVPAAAQAKAGDVWIAETRGADPGRISSFDPATGVYTPVAQAAPLVSPEELTFGPDGKIYVAGGSDDAVYRVDPATGAIATVAAGPPLDSTTGVEFGPAGELYVSSAINDSVVRVDIATGAMTVFAAPIDSPQGLALGRDGYLYVSSNENVHRVDLASGVAAPLLTTPNATDDPEDLDQDPLSGLLYVADSDISDLFTVDPASGQLGTLSAPTDDARGIVFSPTELYTLSLFVLQRADRTTGAGTDLTSPGQIVGGEGLTIQPPTCAGKTATIVGSEGADKIIGTPFADVISVLGGKDKVSAGRGKDTVCGGRGKDKLNGGAGKDKLRGQAGKDRLAGGKGKDTCAGGKGDDSGKGCEKGKV